MRDRRPRHHGAGLHQRQLGAFVIEPVRFGKWFEVAPDALEYAPKLIGAGHAVSHAQTLSDFCRYRQSDSRS